jgi:hypothetical protein
LRYFRSIRLSISGRQWLSVKSRCGTANDDQEVVHGSIQDYFCFEYRSFSDDDGRRHDYGPIAAKDADVYRIAVIRGISGDGVCRFLPSIAGSHRAAGRPGRIPIASPGLPYAVFPGLFTIMRQAAPCF